jgi:DNA repair exonuclease SbcCD ATPase subunit
MTDNNKYINAYVDIAIGTIHEYLAANIQLKAQNKIANDLVSEKDKIIASLQSEITSINKNTGDMQVLQSNAKSWEESYNAMKNKVGHMDALTKQMIEMKREISIRDEKIQELEDKLAELNKKSRKKQSAIEIKNKIEEDVVIPAAKIENEKLPIDDF